MLLRGSSWNLNTQQKSESLNQHGPQITSVSCVCVCVCVRERQRERALPSAPLHCSIHPIRQLFGHAWHPTHRIHWKIITNTSIYYYRMCWLCHFLCAHANIQKCGNATKAGFCSVSWLRGPIHLLKGFFNALWLLKTLFQNLHFFNEGFAKT